jgi:hypothetical protein
MVNSSSCFRSYVLSVSLIKNFCFPHVNSMNVVFGPVFDDRKAAPCASVQQFICITSIKKGHSTETAIFEHSVQGVCHCSHEDCYCFKFFLFANLVFICVELFIDCCMNFKLCLLITLNTLQHGINVHLSHVTLPSKIRQTKLAAARHFIFV